jgi:hypothetical protein
LDGSAWLADYYDQDLMGLSTHQAYEKACQVLGVADVVFVLPQVDQVRFYRDSFVSQLAPGVVERMLLGCLNLRGGRRVFFYTNTRPIQGLNAIIFRALPDSRDPIGLYEWETDESRSYRNPCSSRFQRIDKNIV